MWIAAPDFPIAPEIKEALHAAVESEDVFYNTDNAAMEAMAEKIRRFNKIQATPDDVMVMHGVDPSIWLAVKHACSRGDEVILTDPMYSPFKGCLDVSGAKGVIWELEEEEGYTSTRRN
jgi:aspartate aminotransferase